MDLDEVYYDAGTCGRSYRENRRDAGEKKKIIVKMKLREYGELSRKRDGKVDLRRCFVAVIKTLR